jgi:hypothetical protein
MGAPLVQKAAHDVTTRQVSVWMQVFKNKVNDSDNRVIVLR